jgi:aldose sugar dehydrogenase
VLEPKNVVPGRGFVVAWHLLSLLLVLLAPSQSVRGVGLWTLPPAEMVQPFIMGLAYLLLALFLSTRGSVYASIAFTVAVFGATALFPELVPVAAWSRLVMAESVVLAILLAYIGAYTGRYGWYGVGALVIGVGALIAVGAREAHAQNTGARVISTALKSVRLTIQHPIAPQPDAGGGIAAFGTGFIVVTAHGDVYELHWDIAADMLRATRLPTTVPLDRATFLADLHAMPRPPLLRVTGVAIDTTASPTKLAVAYQYWNHERKCFTLRVSSTELRPANTGASAMPTAWSSVYETHPCVPLVAGYDEVENGGRLALDRSRHLLLTVGDQGADSLVGRPPAAQQMDGDYGKVLQLDGRGGARIFTSGHRNPQGLLVDRQGRVWETEHGPEGGDELNLLIDGKNYGWPLATYGTDYGRTFWPLAPTAHNHGKFEEPVHVWVPSIAPSDLIEVGGRAFPEWDGDLLIGSLKAQALFRVRLVGSRVIYVEPIHIGMRIRDLAEGSDGHVVIWTDGGDVLALEPNTAEITGDAVYERQCSRCHEAVAGGTTIGPQLRGLSERSVADEPNYSYSPALRRLGGRWTRQRLHAFIADPAGFAPGTKMAFKGLVDARERKLLVDYLWERY